ncbi:MAG: class I SAM-dependent methyltransferase, partial [Flavobacteriaceae bacterium]
MRQYSIFVILLVFSCSLIVAQTTDEIKERNERIRKRWNRSLVSDSTYTFNKEVNNLLKQTTEAINPGKALCVAMGQGRNALYLARNNWEVSGFDLADEAVAFAMAQAEKEQLTLNTEIASFYDYDFGAEKWDLITWLYGGCLDGDFAAKITAALKPGG